MVGMVDCMAIDAVVAGMVTVPWTYCARCRTSLVGMIFRSLKGLFIALPNCRVGDGLAES